MKRFLLILVTMLACSMSFAVQDESEDIEIRNEGVADNLDRPRAPAYIPISATHYCSLSTVLVTFRRNIGEVQIEIQNLSNGNSSSLEVDSADGSCLVPCSDVPGYYRITFTTNTGTVYYGEFEIS